MTIVVIYLSLMNKSLRKNYIKNDLWSDMILLLLFLCKQIVLQSTFNRYLQTTHFSHCKLYNYNCRITSFPHVFLLRLILFSSTQALFLKKSGEV